MQAGNQGKNLDGLQTTKHFVPSQWACKHPDAASYDQRSAIRLDSGREKESTHAFNAVDGDALGTSPQRNPRKRDRDTWVDGPTPNTLPHFTTEAFRKERKGASSDSERARREVGKPQDQYLSGLGLSTHVSPPFSGDLVVSLISPRTSKKIRWLPRPGESEQDLLLVSVSDTFRDYRVSKTVIE